ncbi:response regulator [Desulfopila sp. IMCC35008]|uniref:response regulator n=1 Tax=Desulfopila sp. IMCC35008 TaxID=2653858 RepID=UPI0013D06874|nr:response regulator [Desulfopila sp. IMCC35008]
MSTHILIVEDSQELSELLSAYLEQAGFRTSCLYEGTGVEEYVRLQTPDLVLLDLMLPGKDGVDICHGIRTFSQVPVIMVTARVEERDRLNGLDIGADDYICKPFSPREVVARVKAVLRRTGPQGQEEKLLRLDPDKLRAAINGVEIDCTVVEFELLSILANHPGRVFSRAQLIEQIYRDQRMVSDRTVDSHVKKLRKKISRICEFELIHSVYSAGYKYQE